MIQQTKNGFLSPFRVDIHASYFFVRIDFPVRLVESWSEVMFDLLFRQASLPSLRQPSAATANEMGSVQC
jgi:hypothetical protein